MIQAELTTTSLIVFNGLRDKVPANIYIYIVFSSAVHTFEYIVCRVCVPGQSSYKSIFMVYTERRVGVSCSVYDTLHTDAKGYIIMRKLAKLAFCLCCDPIDP